MSNLLFSLMNASKPIRRAVALSFLLLVALVPLSILVIIALNITDLSRNIEAQRLSLGHLTAFISSAARATENSPPPENRNPEELFLTGATAAIAQANLQTLVTDIAKKASVDVASASGLPPSENGRLRLTGVRLSLQGGMATMYEAIKKIELATPPLVIREASIRNVTPVQSSMLSGPIQLTADLSVYGVLSPTMIIEESAVK